MDLEIKARVREVWSKIYPGKPAPKDMVLLKLHGRDSSNGCIIMLAIDTASRKPAVLVKIPRTPSFTKQIDRELESLDYLLTLNMDKDVRRHMPAGAVQTTVGGKKILIEGACEGYPMVREFLGRESIERMYTPMMEWLSCMNVANSEPSVEFPSDMVAESITSLMGRLQGEFVGLYVKLGGETKAYLQCIRERLQGKKVRMVHQHGDFNAYNILVNMQGTVLSNFYVIDWEDFTKSCLPIYDLNHFFVCNASLLDAGGCKDTKFDKYIVSDSWYRRMYISTGEKYANDLGIDVDAYWALSPLYFIGMAMNVGSAGRQQGETAARWIAWANSFVEGFPKLRPC